MKKNINELNNDDIRRLLKDVYYYTGQMLGTITAMRADETLTAHGIDLIYEDKYKMEERLFTLFHFLFKNQIEEIYFGKEDVND